VAGLYFINGGIELAYGNRIEDLYGVSIRAGNGILSVCGNSYEGNLHGCPLSAFDGAGLAALLSTSESVLMRRGK
jgi:hypothetical protein